jgi:hypothetical protein
MSWVLVVSGDDLFQQRSMAALGGSGRAVGAITDSSARRLVGSLRPGTVLVDGGDDEGVNFLISLRLLPESARPQAIVVGDAQPGIRCGAVTTLEAALQVLATTAA